MSPTLGVGSAALQTAKLMGFIVYTTASEKHHEYLKGLGASRTFDYKVEDVTVKIIKAVKEDDLSMTMAYEASGKALGPVLDVMKEVKGEGTAKVASAQMVTEASPKAEGVEAKFVLPPQDPKERLDLYHHIFNVWLKEKLATGEFVPSPGVKVLEGGLNSAQKALDELKAGTVSGQKLVVELA
jgi:hypothetical protein